MYFRIADLAVEYEIGVFFFLMRYVAEVLQKFIGWKRNSPSLLMQAMLIYFLRILTGHMSDDVLEIKTQDLSRN